MTFHLRAILLNLKSTLIIFNTLGTCLKEFRRRDSSNTVQQVVQMDPPCCIQQCWGLTVVLVKFIQ